MDIELGLWTVALRIVCKSKKRRHGCEAKALVTCVLSIAGGVGGRDLAKEGSVAVLSRIGGWN